MVFNRPIMELGSLVVGFYVLRLLDYFIKARFHNLCTLVQKIHSVPVSQIPGL